MSSDRNRVVIVADDYQFLDTLTGPSAAIVQEWQVANTLERLAEFVTPAPLAVVIDLEAPGFDPVDALTLLESTRAASKIVLLTGPDLRKLANAKRIAENLSLEIAGTLERPLMMTALSRLLSRHAESRAPITAEELQRGLREHELLLHYQPIFARQAGEWRLRSTEALVRWQHPGRGLLYPGQFLKLAESAGLLGELTDFVFAAAMRQAGSWEAQGLELAVRGPVEPVALTGAGRPLADGDAVRPVGARVDERHLGLDRKVLARRREEALDETPAARHATRRVDGKRRGADELVEREALGPLPA